MAKQTITVIKGDGIGPSIIDSALEILEAAGCDFDYEFVDAGLAALEKTGELLPQETIDTIARNKITLKG
ncbi:MAG: isocitrate dehydrogenase, partial [Pseudoalteromonas sp.]|nr:isocitrate dehydrogenase [Pseudoalteromonas sp.]